ncbi:hypothetical protein H7T88_15645 [Paenibacillus cucumis Kampfer et al. 2016]|uniref:DUF3298 domain-containing protein n=1 Tax=Paenibacillus cucumis (ex Kampfer et al. 2016) TaxID=1776858 RepID=A0ABS7KKL3_9BACL|nr:hypothetical protein [Paenibacillus cucumis (ex Kampfer et al. 2016)]
MKRICLFLFFALGVLLVSCTTTNQASEKQETQTKSESILPAGYTLDAIKVALQNYINNQLWYNSGSNHENSGQNITAFEKNIGQNIQLEIRNYNGKIYAINSAEKNDEEWLAYFNLKNGIVYCDSLLFPKDSAWPQEKYELVEYTQIDIQEPHQPTYSDSPYKDKMVTAAINYLEKFLIDMKSGEQAKDWDHVQGYLVNFQEYDETANAWFIKSNGEAVYVPFAFIENNGTITVDGITGYSVKNMMDKATDDPDRIMFERQINDAVKQLSNSSNEWDSISS